MLLSVSRSRRWLRITPGYGIGVPSAPKASHSSTTTPWERLGMKDGKSLPVPSARYSERARDLRISNNYIKQLKENKKTWKIKFRSPNSCPIGSI